MKQILREIYKNNKGIFYFTLFVATFSAVSAISVWVVQKYILDSIVSSEDYKIILYFIILLFVTYWFSQVFGALTYYFSSKFWKSVSKDYKRKSLEKFNKIRFDIVLDKKQWEINNIISKWASAIGDLVEQSFANIIQNGLMIIFWLIVLFIVDVYIFLYFIILFIPIFVLYSLKQMKRILPSSKNLDKKDNKVSWEIIEYLSNIRDIKILWAEQDFMKIFFRKIGSIFHLETGIEKKHHFMNFNQFVILIWSMCLVLAYTSYSIVIWLLTVWTFLLVYDVFVTIRHSLWSMIYLYRDFEENVIKVHKLIDFFDLEEGENQVYQNIQWFEKLEVQKLKFSFNKDHKVLNSIDFSIHSWDKIAIIWKSGQWKTTLINIILWLYEWYTWGIFVNNNKVIWNIRDIFSYVPQDVQVFNENLKFNLTLWGKFKDTDLIDMLKKVWLSYLSKRAKKWKTILDIMVGSDGLKLSGWEKQRLWIARAMIRDKDIYVFDEITSSLDEETEKDIIDLIFSISKNKTFIIISHKKEILKKVDKVYEMKNGKLI